MFSLRNILAKKPWQDKVDTQNRKLLECVLFFDVLIMGYIVLVPKNNLNYQKMQLNKEMFESIMNEMMIENEFF
jgi:hypothetical protein